MNEKKNTLSVANEITALALINIQDIFHFVLTAKDVDIEKRYGSEWRAMKVAEKYLNIAVKASLLERQLSGWSMKYSQPIVDSDERVKKMAYFFDVKNSREGDFDEQQ